MAAFLSLYCACPVSHLTSKDVLTGIDYGTYFRLVRRSGHVSDEAADSALAHLRIDTIVGKSRCFFLRFAPGEVPAVPVVVLTDPDDVADWCQTALRGLPASDDPAVELVRGRLPRVVECVSIRLGWETIDAGFALGWAAGEFLARLGDALLLDEYENWWIMRNRTPVHLFRSP
jgi:hypothetical protein